VFFSAQYTAVRLASSWYPGAFPDFPAFRRAKNTVAVSMQLSSVVVPSPNHCVWLVDRKVSLHQNSAKLRICKERPHSSNDSLLLTSWIMIFLNAEGQRPGSSKHASNEPDRGQMPKLHSTNQRNKLPHMRANRKSFQAKHYQQANQHGKHQ
jgi:hypothetical protein